MLFCKSNIKTVDMKTLIYYSVLFFPFIAFSQISNFETDVDGWGNSSQIPILDYSAPSCDGFKMYRGEISDFQQNVIYPNFSDNSTFFLGFNRADEACNWEEMVIKKTYDISTMNQPVFVMDYFIGNSSSSNLIKSTFIVYNDPLNTYEEITSFTENAWDSINLVLNPPANATEVRLHITIGGEHAAGFDNIGIIEQTNLALENYGAEGRIFQIKNNPVHDLINIEFTDKHNSIENFFEIYTINGQKVTGGQINSQKMEIDISMLQSGIYLFKVDNQIQKIIKS